MRHTQASSRLKAYGRRQNEMWAELGLLTDAFAELEAIMKKFSNRPEAGCRGLDSTRKHRRRILLGAGGDAQL